MLKRTLLVALSLGVLLTLASRPAEAVPVLSTLSTTIFSSSPNFTLPITITGAADLTSWQFDLSFDPTILRANYLIEGPFMSSFGATLFIPPLSIDNTTGLISGTADFYIDLPPNPSGSGILATVNFTAISPGVSPINFSNVFLNLSDQGFQVVNRQITVLAAEPSTLLLLSTGLLFLTLVKFRRRALRDEV